MTLNLSAKSFKLLSALLLTITLGNLQAQDAMTITPAGNVGIGVANPVAKLQVSGELSIGRADGQSTVAEYYTRFGMNPNWQQYIANNARWDVSRQNWFHVNTDGYYAKASIIIQEYGKFYILNTNSPAEPIVWENRLMINDNGETQINGRVKDKTGYLVPVGGIIMYSGNSSELFEGNGLGKAGSAVEGWALCDGQGGRVDMTDRFVLGAVRNATSAGRGDEGGSHTIKLTVGQLPPHTHKYSWPGQWGGGDENAQNYDNNGLNAKIRDTSPTGSGEPIDIRPAYFRVFYIIKL